MEREVKRYRVSPKKYLCISPEEALSSGITVGEEMLEEITLTRATKLKYPVYATIREIPEEELSQIAVIARNERLFEEKKEAIRYIKEKKDEGPLVLYAMQDRRMLSRREVKEVEDISVPDFMEELKRFEVK